MKLKPLFKLSVVLILLAISAALSISYGATDTSFAQIASDIKSQKGVVWLFRLPRTLSAILVGFCFAVSGTLLQSLTRNPLASPDLLGVTSGGGLATVVAILVGGSAVGPHLPFIAFLGGSAVASIIWALGRNASPQRFILTGVALSAFTHAIITLMLVTYAPSAAEALIWLKGSLFGRGWVHVKHIVPWALFVFAGSLMVAYQANPLVLGPTISSSLGVPLRMLKLSLWVLSVAAASAAVAVAGTIGFVGLLVPHLSRMLCGSDLRIQLPFSGALGALFVLNADTLGRVLAPPLEIPAGLICAFLGAPYFGYLLWKGKTKI